VSWTAVLDADGAWRFLDSNKIYGGGAGLIVHGFATREEAVEWAEKRQEDEWAKVLERAKTDFDREFGT